MKNKFIYLFVILISFAFYNNTTAQTTILSQNFEGNAWTPTAYVVGTTGGSNTTIPDGAPANTPSGGQVWQGYTGGGGTNNALWHRSDYQGAWSTANDICGGTYQPPTCGANGTSHAAYLDNYDASSNTYGVIQSPAMNLSSYCTATLTFYYYNRDGRELDVEFWNGSSWVFAATLSTIGNSWALQTVTVPTSCLVNGALLAFVGVSNFGLYPIGIDEIVLKGTSGGPTNDACASATALTSGVSLAGQTNVCATTAASDPNPFCANLGTNNSVWYTITIATASTINVAVTDGTMTYAAVSVYTGACGSFSQISCSSPNTSGGNPSLTTSCLAAGTYYIMVWDDAGTSGTFSIKATATACVVSNDACGSAYTIPAANLSGAWNTGFNNTTSTSDGTASPYDCYSNNDWYTFTAQGPNLEISASSGSNCDPEIALFSNNPCSGAGTLIGAATYQHCAGSHITYSTISLMNNNSSLTAPNYFTITTGQQYWFSITSHNGCTYSVQVNNPSDPDPAGTDCATAQILCAGGTYSGAAQLWGNQELTTATIQQCNLGEEINSSWYVLNVLTGGTLTFSLNPVDGVDDYDYGIYSGATCTLGAPVSCNYSSQLGVTGISTSAGGASNNTNAAGVTWNQDLNVTTGGVYIMLVNGYTPSSGSYGFTFGGTAVLGCTLPVILPISLLSFTATPNGSEVDLKWSIATETGNKYFTIERSKDGQNFEEVCQVKGAGTSTEKTNYTAVDYAPLPGVSYYKISQTDFNGVTHALTIVMVNNTDNDGMFAVIPNPTNGLVAINYSCNSATTGILNVYDGSGVLQVSKEITCVSGNNKTQLDLSDKTNGIYLVTFTTNDKFYRTKLIKR